jgi:murein DD-endopeptidase MepM/ murein hydrolase activator NlpD
MTGVPTLRLLAVPLLVLATSLPALAVAVPSTRPAEGVWPLSPRPAVVHRFDPPTERWGRGHRGVDLAGRVGQQVRAAVAGQVTFAGRIAGVGSVVVSHGGTRTTYQPVDASVRRGEQVAAGERLGRLEWHGTHCSPAACLHWGLLRGEQYLDPLALVDAPGPVRLLPSGGLSAVPAAPPTSWGRVALRLGGVPVGTPAAAARW